MSRYSGDIYTKSLLLQTKKCMINLEKSVGGEKTKETIGLYHV